MKRMNNEAVSPVVGVMLMLVVTIIIAAVVSAFTGGLAGGTSKAPQASLTVEPVLGDLNATEGAYGLLFEHKGGDAFSLNDIAIELDNKGVTMIIKGSDLIPATTYGTGKLSATATDGGFFAKVGSDTSDKIISPGDKFMFYASSFGLRWGSYYLFWDTNEDASIALGYGPINELYKWSVIDLRSSKTISSGEFILK